MGKPSTSANANVDFDIANLTNIIAGFAANDRNDLVFVIENGTEFDFEVNYKAGYGLFNDDSHGSTLKAIKFEEGGHPKASDYELSFQANGAGCNVVLTLFCQAKNRFYFIMGATPVNKENYFKFNGFVPIFTDEKNYSSNGFKKFTDDHFEFEISITGTSPAVCKVVIREV